MIYAKATINISHADNTPPHSPDRTQWSDPFELDERAELPPTRTDRLPFLPPNHHLHLHLTSHNSIHAPLSKLVILEGRAMVGRSGQICEIGNMNHQLRSD